MRGGGSRAPVVLSGSWLFAELPAARCDRAGRSGSKKDTFRKVGVKNFGPN